MPPRRQKLRPSSNDRCLREPDDRSRRQAVIRIEAVDVEASGKGAAQGTRASQPPRQSEHLNIVDSPERAVNQRVWSSEVRYNVNLETRDEDVVLIGEHRPFRRHIG